MKKYSWLFLPLLISLAACESRTTNNTKEDVAESSQKMSAKVIYGVDDRLDLFEVMDEQWMEKANSTVALMRSSKLKETDDGQYKITLSHYGKTKRLCSGEPFYDQSTAAFCSGSLIAPDVIMTAGHCIRNESTCKTTKFVFDFAYQEEGQDISITDADNVYSCEELIVSDVASRGADYALIRLDRPVVGRDPLAIRQSGETEVGMPLTVIGHPAGLPTKVAGDASVRSVSNPAYFVANLDTYGGNSGSAVFNEETGIVEGILVRGERDFSYEGGCYVSNECTEDGCRGEDVTKVSEVLEFIDASELVPEEESNDIEEDVVDGDNDADDNEVLEPLQSAESGTIEVAIPDLDAKGLSNMLGPVIESEATQVAIHIEHSWIGDLEVTLQSPSGVVKILHDRDGGSANQIIESYQWGDLEEVGQEPASGKWILKVRDWVIADTGQLVSWGLSHE